MFCRNCGTKVEDNSKFCPNCGAKLDAGYDAFNDVGKNNNENYTPYGAGGYNQYNSQYNGGAPKSNGMAIAGFVCSFFIPLLGLIFSILGYNRSKTMNGAGRGLAIAGIVISVVEWVIGIITVLAQM